MDRHLHDLLEAAVGEPPHRVNAEAVRRRVIRRRVVEFAAAAVAVAAIAVIIPVGIGALGRTPGPSNRGHTPRPVFTSHVYGYTETLPPGWRSDTVARRPWNGKGAPGYDRRVVDLFTGPTAGSVAPAPGGGLQAWVYAVPTNKTLRAYTTATIRAEHLAHPCPAHPQTNQGITIGGAPARLLSMQCAPGSGFVVETAVTVHHGTAFVVVSQHQPGTPVHYAADRAAFRAFLAGIRLQL